MYIAVAIKKSPLPIKNGAGHMVVQGNKWGIWLNLMTLDACALLFLAQVIRMKTYMQASGK